jgi:hypothetical protein
MLEQLLIQRTHRVPRVVGSLGDGAALARQLDAALMSVGFKASRGLLEHLSALDPDVGLDTARTVVAAVRQLVGDDAEHNAYFASFPAGVPDTVEFWSGLLAQARAQDGPGLGTAAVDGSNLLDLPGYGTYQHSYAEMLAEHDAFVKAVTDRVTVLHLGDSLEQEAQHCYLELGGATTPLSGSELALFEQLAAWCAQGEQPASIPVRENRAIINRVRLAHRKPLLIETPTDVLRLAAAACGGDVGLLEPARLRSPARRDRRALLAALDRVAGTPAALAEVSGRREQWKRLGERLHPHEYAHAYPHAGAVFAVARGELEAPSLAGRVDAAFAAGQGARAVELLGSAPGMLLRSVDRCARSLPAGEMAVLRDAVQRASAHASGRVLLSLREHLANRSDAPASDAARIYVGRTAHAWVEPDRRGALPPELVAELTGILDRAIAERMPTVGHLVIDPAVAEAAVPLSGKATSAGYGVMPRGSRTTVSGATLRFFIHWQQAERPTDYDLSVLLLDEHFEHEGHISYNNLNGFGGVHSGDLTEAPAPDGASEFIDLDLAGVPAHYIIPQVDIFDGESFTEATQSVFGYMSLDSEQLGKPFEPRTVRMKAEVRGGGRVALPVVFEHTDRGWEAVWMNLFAHGESWGNRVEDNRLSSALLARTILNRRYLTLGYLIEAMSPRADRISEWHEGDAYDGPVTFIGLERPEGLADDSEIYDLRRWSSLVPV